MTEEQKIQKLLTQLGYVNVQGLTISIINDEIIIRAYFDGVDLSKKDKVK